MANAPDDQPPSNFGKNDTNRPSQEQCRSCGKPVDSSDPSYPFCSDRCRLVDLGAWFNESYRVARPIDEVDEIE